MRVFYLYILSSLVISQIIGQHRSRFEYSTKDSLLTTYDNAGNNTERIKALNNLSEVSKFIDVVKANEYALKASHLAKQTNSTKLLGFAYYHLAETLFLMGKTDSANNHYHMAEQIGKQLNDKYLQAHGWAGKGLVYKKRGIQNQATKYYLQAIKAFKQEGDLLNLANCYQNYAGLFYGALANRNYFYEYNKRALNLFQKLNCLSGVGHVYNNFAIYNHIFGDHHKAINYGYKAYYLFKKIGDLHGIGVITINMGEFHKELNNLDSALYFLKESHSINSSILNADFLVNLMESLASVYFLKKDYQKAIEYNLKGIEYHNKYKLGIIIVANYQNLANIYDTLGNIPLSNKYLKLSYQHYKKYAEQNAQKQITEMQTKFDTEQKEAEIKLLGEQNKVKESNLQRKQIQVYASILGIALSLIFGIFIYRKNKQTQQLNCDLKEKNEEVNAQAEELLATNERLKELDAFKENMTGMIVHDLKNPLNSIIGLSDSRINTRKQKTIHQMGTQLLHMVENILDIQKYENSNVQLNPGDYGCIELLKASLEQVHMLIAEKRISILLQQDQDFILHIDYEIILRVLVNLLTNAIKFTPTGGEVRLEFEKTEQNKQNWIKIWIKDNGEGIPTDKINTIFDKFSQAGVKSSGRAKSTGLGLTYCKMMVEAHGGTIEVQSQEGEGTQFGFTVLSTGQKQIEAKPVVVTHEIAKNTTFQLSDEDREMIEPILKLLQNFEVFEITEIRETLKNIPDSNTLKPWKDALESALYACDEDQYNFLTQS